MARRLRSLGAALLVGFLLLLSPSVRAIELEHDRYANPKLGLHFTVPHNWILTRQTGYPPLLAILTSVEHPASQIAIAYAKRDGARPLAALVRANNQALRSLGVRIISSGAMIHLGHRVWRTRATWQAKEGTLEVQQIYLAGPDQTVFVVTATAPKVERIIADVDMLVESIEGTT